MDTSNPSVLVNGDILRTHLGRRVRTVIKVLRPVVDGITGISTDDKQIIVKGNISSPRTTFIEVIGIANAPQSIQADILTNFGDTVDTDDFNQLCTLANGDYRHLFL